MDLTTLGQIPLESIHDRPPVVVSVDDPLFDVARLMSERSCGAVLVNEGERLAGIFTERDLMFKVDHADDSWQRMPVRELMTCDLVCVKKTDSIAKALKLMLDGGFRHLPVVGDNKQALFVISIRDVLAYIAEHFPKQFLNLPPDPSREASEPYGG